MRNLMFMGHQHGGDDVTWKPRIPWTLTWLLILDHRDPCSVSFPPLGPPSTDVPSLLCKVFPVFKYSMYLYPFKVWCERGSDCCNCVIFNNCILWSWHMAIPGKQTAAQGCHFSWVRSFFCLTKSMSYTVWTILLLFLQASWMFLNAKKMLIFMFIIGTLYCTIIRLYRICGGPLPMEGIVRRQVSSHVVLVNKWNKIGTVTSVA
jgi:hypothetical protein